MSNEEKPVSIQDVRLVRAAAGDKGEAERMLSRIVPKIRQIARAVVSDPCHAEDVSQAAVEEVLRSLHSYQGQGSLDAWAARIAFRTAVRHEKEHRNWRGLHRTLVDEHTAIGPLPEDGASLHEIFFSLEKHLSSISAMRRTPLLLHLVYGHTVREVSEIVDAPENTIKHRLKKAIRELREILVENPALKQAMLEVIHERRQ